MEPTAQPKKQQSNRDDKELVSLLNLSDRAKACAQNDESGHRHSLIYSYRKKTTYGKSSIMEKNLDLRNSSVFICRDHSQMQPVSENAIGIL